ncbi:hypothetical protein FKM82_005854 [Ascaphus truei]
MALSTKLKGMSIICWHLLHLQHPLNCKKSWKFSLSAARKKHFLSCVSRMTRENETSDVNSAQVLELPPVACPHLYAHTHSHEDQC